MKKAFIHLILLTLFISISCSQQKPKEESKKSVTNYTEINKSGVINTFVDGIELWQVNIWKSNMNKDQIVTVCKKNEVVTVLLSDGTYYQIRTSDGKEGWLMNGFVVLKE